jgi:MATE family multidrug resistance protein
LSKDSDQTAIGAELKALVTLSWPIVLAQAGVIAMALVDTAILGHAAVEDLAGAAMGRSIGFASLILGMGIAVGLEPLASQALGAGEPARAWEGLRTNLRACLLWWVPAMASAFVVTLALRPLGVEARVIERVRAFLLGQSPGMLLTLLYLSTKTFLQAHQRTLPSLIASGVANLTNVVVCNLLVRGDDALAAVHLPRIGLPRLGALGAGMAFSFACVVLFGIVAYAARVYRPRTRAPPVPMRTAWKLGLPIGAQMLAEMGVFTVAALLAGSLGTHVVAAHQIAIGLASFSFMGALGVASATAVRVGRAVGAGTSPRRAGILGMGLGAAVMMGGTLVFALVPHAIVGLFTDNPEVVQLGSTLVRIAAVFQLFDGVQAVAAGALRGAGDLRFPFAANVGAHWLIGFPTALALGFAAKWGASGLWWGLTSGLVVASFVLAYRFVRISRGPIARV